MSEGTDMLRTRVGLGVLGVAGGVYGAYLLLTRQDFDQIKSAVIWLIGGVIIHDAIIALVAVAVVALGARVLPEAGRAPAVIALIVVTSTTFVIIPVLSGMGGQAGEYGLQERPYGVSWLGFMAFVVGCAVVAGVLRARRHDSTGFREDDD